MTDEKVGTTAAVAKRLREAAESSELERYPLGYSLDARYGMIGQGELGLLIARSGSGKSTFYLNVCARTGHVPTVIFNMEMRDTLQLLWLAAMTLDLGVPCSEVEACLRNRDDVRRKALIEQLDSLPRYHPWLTFETPEEGAPDIDYFVRRCDAIWDATGVRPKRIIIDHFGLMAGTSDYDGTLRQMRRLKEWSRNDDIAVIVVQQSGRGSSDGKQRNDGHLPVTKSSGVFAGEDRADWIWGLYRPELWSGYHDDPEKRASASFARIAGITRLQVVKNRPFGKDNQVGVDLRFDHERWRLYERDQPWPEPQEIATDVF